jgi:pimeloyl-ACP methyl ester carboxylesterase
MLRMTAAPLYDCIGSGPDILLVHGFASSRRVWASLIGVLAESARCWAVDLPGFGAHKLPDHARPSLENQLVYLTRFCDERSIRPFAMVAHSMGGMLALKLAQTRPDLAERLVLVCPSVTGRLHFGFHRLIASPVGRFLLPRSYPLWQALQSPLVPDILFGSYLSPTARKIKADDFRKAAWGASVTALHDMAAGDFAPSLADIRQRSLVIVGSRDRTVPPFEGRHAARHLPAARLEEFARSHHEPFDEEPERFNTLVRGFVLEPSMSRVDP